MIDCGTGLIIVSHIVIAGLVATEAVVEVGEHLGRDERAEGEERQTEGGEPCATTITFTKGDH